MNRLKQFLKFFVFVKLFDYKVTWTLDNGHWTMDIGRWTMDIRNFSLRVGNPQFSMFKMLL